VNREVAIKLKNMKDRLNLGVNGLKHYRIDGNPSTIDLERHIKNPNNLFFCDLYLEVSKSLVHASVVFGDQFMKDRMCMIGKYLNKKP
jgi:hypothetical protein